MMIKIIICQVGRYNESVSYPPVSLKNTIACPLFPVYQTLTIILKQHNNEYKYKDHP